MQKTTTSSSFGSSSSPPPPSKDVINPKDFQVQGSGSKLKGLLREKKEDWRTDRARRIAQRPAHSTGPVNANPPVFASSSSLSVLFANSYGFSQGVILNDSQLKVTGMGGWDRDGNLMGTVSEQIGMALDNVEATLRELRWGGCWDFVYSVKTYHTDLEGSAELMAAHLQARMQRHRPLWTCIEVSRLRLPGMCVEVEVEAYLEKQDAGV